MNSSAPSQRPSCAWYSDERFYWHDPGLGSGYLPVGPDIQPLRDHGVDPDLRRAEGLLRRSATLDAFVSKTPRPATDAELRLVHSQSHIDRIEVLAAMGGGESGIYAPVGFHTALAARLAVGACVEAASESFGAGPRRSYCLVRPPGHHAEPERAMGLCIYNNLAIAARAVLREQARRVLILDWDVHHGNGFQTIFADDPRVLLISIHQDGLFPPLMGRAAEAGRGEAQGLTINIPLPAGSGHEAYLAALEQIVVPAARAFAPDLMLVAAGLDASAHDPMGRQLCTSQTFRALALGACGLADELCAGRIVFAHEGGYSTWYLPIMVRAVAAAIAGLPEQPDPFLHSLEHLPGQRLQDHQQRRIDQVLEIHRRIGKLL